MHTDLTTFVRYIVELIVKKEYFEFERLEWIPQGVSADLERFINEYGATIVQFPVGDDSDIEIRQYPGDEELYRVIADLHSQEEGRSDLSLVLDIRDERNGAFKVTNFDVDVL